MTDGKLARGAVAVLAGVGVLVLLIAARSDGYGQAVLINLGTGVVLFAALEHALYGTAERVTALVTELVQANSPERWLEMTYWADTLTSEAREALVHQLQANSPLPVAVFDELELQLRAIDQMDASEHLKGISSLAVLTNHYGIRGVRDELASRRATARPAPDAPGA
jgi:hypothetical protein